MEIRFGWWGRCTRTPIATAASFLRPFTRGSSGNPSPLLSGKKNLCFRQTMRFLTEWRGFRRFRPFRGLKSKALVFRWLECQFVIVAIPSEHPFFEKHTVACCSSAGHAVFCLQTNNTHPDMLNEQRFAWPTMNGDTPSKTKRSGMRHLNHGQDMNGVTSEHAYWSGILVAPEESQQLTILPDSLKEGPHLLSLNYASGSLDQSTSPRTQCFASLMLLVSFSDQCLPLVQNVGQNGHMGFCQTGVCLLHFRASRRIVPDFCNQEVVSGSSWLRRVSWMQCIFLVEGALWRW